MFPTPNPTPILVQVQGNGSTFWDSPLFVALLTLLGVFTGAVLTWLFKRADDKLKVQRDRDEAIARETLDRAAEMITLSSQFTKLGQRGLVVPLDEWLPIVVPESAVLIEEHTLLLNRFRLVMPSSLENAVNKYSALTISLVVPPFDSTLRTRLDMQADSQAKLVNDLRKLRGLTDLDSRSRMGGQDRKEKFADRAAAQLRNQLAENGIPIVNEKGEEQRP